MSLGQLERALKEIEQQLKAASTALVQGEPGALEHASAALKDMAVNFSSLLQRQNAQGLSRTAIKVRIVAIRDGLSHQRTNLIRRTVTIDSALNALMPTTRPSTYASQSGRFGAHARQTGAFKVLAA